jgi:Na+/H+-dicarboxylate symporter
VKWWFRQQLYMQILVAIVVGVALGLAFGDRVSLIEPVGIIFIRLLKMLIVPLTFLTLISGITKLESIRSLRSIGGLALLYYALSSLVAGTVGVAVALLIRPGVGMTIDAPREASGEVAKFDLVDQLVH